MNNSLNNFQYTKDKKVEYILMIDDTTGYSKEPVIYKEYVPTLRAERFGLKVLSTVSDN